MDLRQLLYFTTLAETLNFHRAAERLNTSQPPLTVAIRKLEEELGAALFIRSSRGVTLTSAGEAALEAARAALAQAGRVRRAVQEGSDGKRGRLHIGFVSSAIYGLLPTIIPAFRRRYPNVDLVLDEASSADIAPRIRAGTLDIGLVRLPLLDQGQLEITVVEADELVAAVPPSHPMARRDRLPLSALASDPFILFPRFSVLQAAILTACRDAGFVPHVTQEASQVHTILSLVQSGLGVALVPSNATRYVPDSVRLLRLERPMRIEIGLVLSPDLASPATRNFRELAQSFLDSESLSRTA